MHHLAGIVVKAVTAAFCAFMMVVFVTGSAFAQDTKPQGVALVIGESTYEALPPLPNPGARCPRHRRRFDQARFCDRRRRR